MAVQIPLGAWLAGASAATQTTLTQIRRRGVKMVRGLSRAGRARRVAKRAAKSARRIKRTRRSKSRVKGIKGAIQRIIPGGETGFTGDISRIPGIEGALQRIIPGGETGFQRTDLTPDMHGGVTKSWSANGAIFNMNTDGTITVLKKNGQTKTYRPYKPTVFGKNPDAKKFIKMAKKHKKVWQELNKIYKKPVRRK